MSRLEGGMTVKLALSGLIKFGIGLLLVGAMLFGSAGSMRYEEGWLFLGLLFIPMLILGVILFFKNPSLLAKRLESKEKQKTQKGVVGAAGLMFVFGFVAAGLDDRFGRSDVPLWLVAAASVVLLVSYGLYAEVMRENVYLSRTVEVQERQKVVDTGLYGVIRHPMYAVTIWMFLAIPLVLGSLWALICFLPYPILILLRIQNEEKVLDAELPGYLEYKKKVKYRLIPYIW